MTNCLCSVTSSYVRDVPRLTRVQRAIRSLTNLEMLYGDVHTTPCSRSCFRPSKFKTGIIALPRRDKRDAQPILSSAVLRGAYCAASCALLGASDAPRLLGSTGDVRNFRCAAYARWFWPAVVIRRYHTLRYDCALGTRVASRTYGQCPSAYNGPITFAQLLFNKKGNYWCSAICTTNVIEDENSTR